jgi:hypothetical protein
VVVVVVKSVAFEEVMLKLDQISKSHSWISQMEVLRVSIYQHLIEIIVKMNAFGANNHFKTFMSLTVNTELNCRKTQTN